MNNEDAIKDIVKETCEGCLYIETCRREDCAFYLAIKALEEQEADRWIPVSERLPEEDGEYLVNVGACYGYIFDVGDVDIYIFKEGKFQTDTPVKITHWRPLPKALESEDEE